MIAIKKGVKMPVNCEECFARVLAWCRLDEEERIVVPAVPWELEDRPEWCPLIDVPDINVGNSSEIPNSSANEWCTTCKEYDADNHNCPRFNRVIREAVEEIQTERKKGQWIDMGDFEQCSVCGGTNLKEFQSYYGKTTWIKTNYCPNCGADMRGEQDD